MVCVDFKWGNHEYMMIEEGIAIVNHSLCDGISVFNPMGCFIKLPLDCKDGHTFAAIKGSMPISMIMSRSSNDLSLRDCEIMCSGNCFMHSICSSEDDGAGCELYYGERTDLLNIIGKGLTLSMFAGILLQILARANGNYGTIKDTTGLLTLAFWSSSHAPSTDDARSCQEFLLLSFSCIARATNNFSAANKIGEEGFGPGNLTGQEIAVKRLSTSSVQGIKEFKTEVQLISKLQHINLVKLLGFCIEQEEKILIYEYMPNKSLDSFIFSDPVKRRLIDWRQCKHIIEGIAQGLLYLHKYSSLRTVHRDLKSSNILLDSHMNPKISDFGMARIFFEIVSGRRNIPFYATDNSSTLLGHYWPIHLRWMSLCNVFRLVSYAQDNTEDRPTMIDIVAILSDESTVLPTPKQPIFSTHLNPMSKLDNS
ncbi:conserved hypothetical protein [Ricinus communis]|uniref:non-specific serine/threonine protein kinase n=1 Tax=Ricinus communis TaxID=3988 RepID=B9SEN1_RICCO|nr:conserved hypothetical protein [Ricinus communis]